MTRTDTGSQSFNRHYSDTCFCRRDVGTRRPPPALHVGVGIFGKAEYLRRTALAGQLRASIDTKIVHNLFDPLSIREHVGPGALLLKCTGAEDVDFTSARALSRQGHFQTFEACWINILA